jgi:cell wall-associated NlpC family hydrolase
MRNTFLTLVLLVVPTVLQAQARTSLSTFVAAGSGIDEVPVLVGGALRSDMGVIGLRLGVGIDGRDTPLEGMLGTGGGESAWGADLDLTATAGSLVRVLAPYYLTAGLGVRSLSRDGAAVLSPVASAGAGYRREFAGRLGFEAEARYRTPVGMSHRLGSPGAEFRLGVSVRLHGTGDLSAPRARARSARSAPPATVAAVGRAAAPAVIRRVLDEADQYLGTPYLWGGTNPSRGFDCSGFVQYLFAKQGIQLPRVTRDQAHAGRPVRADVGALQPGDLMLFASNGSWIDHVAIYAGNGWILHSSSSAGGVRYDPLDGARGEWFRQRLVAARRVL